MQQNVTVNTRTASQQMNNVASTLRWTLVSVEVTRKKNWQNLYRIRTALRSREVCQTRVAALKKISLCAYLLKT